MYENNYAVLRQIVETDGVIRHVSKHRNPDGTLDITGNKKIWNNAIARFQQIRLWEEKTPNFDSEADPLQPEPSIIFVPAQGAKEKRGTIIVAHGGGFNIRTGCEGMNVAYWFANAGFNTAILTYRIEPYTRFDAIDDMQRAIRLLRARREEVGITDKIAVMGFSAGGMLGGNCATHYDLGRSGAEDVIEQHSCRPDAAVVCYGAFAPLSFPGGMFRTLFKGTREQQYYLSVEHNVTCDTPPFFIWQTYSDDARNAFALGSALSAAGVPFEMHIFPDGFHGLALADGHNDLAMDIPHVARWTDLCAEWLNGLGI